MEGMRDMEEVREERSQEGVDLSAPETAPENEEKWVSLSEAARISGINVGTLSRYAKEGRLHSKPGVREIKTLQRVVLVPLDEVLQLPKRTS